MTSRRAVFAAALFAAAAGLPGCSTLTAPAAGRPHDSTEPRQSWAQVLLRFVDEQGRVDFAALAREPADLDRYVAWVNAVGPASHPELFASPAQVLAYHLNAYNALAMHAVIDEGIPPTLAGWRKLSFFVLKRLQVAGRSVSLYGYENDVIRPLKEPRVHFALNCMSVGCPRLPREPFDAARLDAQLERETRLFFSETRNLRVIEAERKVVLSEILSFYAEDFLAAAPSLVAYVNRYRSPAMPADYQVVFTPYDWTVNRQPVPA
jgi:Protein of unknown function, DUF547